MDKKYEHKCHTIEESYWWFEGRRDIVCRIISALGKDSRILEIGCSGGALLKVLKDKGYRSLSGIDISEKAIALCKERGIGNTYVMDGARLSFADGEFDTVVVSDVLEHMKDDAAAIAEWRRVMRPGGKLIVFVPAFDFLWGEHDEVNHHYRRYSRKQLSRIFADAGFTVDRSSYWNAVLFFPVAMIRIAKRLFSRNGEKKSDQFYKVNPFINNTLIKMLKFENGIVEKIDMLFGVSLFCVGSKRSAQ